ncbi:MAG: hypothetical protein CL676_12045 [Bdellovibrionaceae bacterium]|nr:hypothetical protein [Pseudobdellovibrionaceae bacterium]|tara:strand:+ start:500 stop:883 length:384 start_codon:yes stop_codon:yes gene_type:complete
MSSQKINRRNFIGGSLLSVASLAFFKGNLALASDLKPLDLKPADVLENGQKAVPALVNYCTDPDGAAKTCPMRKSDKSKHGQTCANCSFYTPKGTYKGQEVGDCVLAMAQKKKVYASAWCGTWAKKA